MPSIPRIVAVDPGYEIARIVRGAMALLDRQAILVEVPTADDALAEVQQSDVQLVVTAFALAGTATGIELATHIVHETLATPVIVLADADDHVQDEASRADLPFQVYVRPAVDGFLRGLRMALDGEPLLPVEIREPEFATDLPPVPDVDIDMLRDTAVGLMRDVGAMGVIVADRTGRVLVDQGATGYVDRQKLAAILGPSFAQAAGIGELVGGDAWTMQYYDGERLDLFGLALGIHHFMCLVFEGSNRGAFGAVTMFGRRAADQIIEMIGEAAYRSYALPPSPAPAVEERLAVPERVEEEPALFAEPYEEVAALDALFDEEAAPEDEYGPVSDIDLDVLFGQSVDEGLADTLFDLDGLRDLVESLPSDDSSQVGYDEARDMGIIDE
jgi:hypothetical protein